MPNLTQEQWLYVALAAAGLFFLYRKGFLDNLLKARPRVVKAPEVYAPVAPPPVFQSLPASLDDKVLAAARDLKELARQRDELKAAQTLLDALPAQPK